MIIGPSRVLTLSLAALPRNRQANDFVVWVIHRRLPLARSALSVVATAPMAGPDAVRSLVDI